MKHGVDYRAHRAVIFAIAWHLVNFGALPNFYITAQQLSIFGTIIYQDIFFGKDDSKLPLTLTKTWYMVT